MTLSITVPANIIWSHDAECRCAECHVFYCSAECRYAECSYAECHHSECHYSECCYTKCHYAKCRGAVMPNTQHLLSSRWVSSCWVTLGGMSWRLFKMLFYFWLKYSKLETLEVEHEIRSVSFKLNLLPFACTLDGNNSVVNKALNLNVVLSFVCSLLMNV
jgi:hypothetical protein